MRLLLKEPKDGGPFDPKKAKKGKGIEDNIKPLVAKFCNNKNKPMPQFTAVRFGKTELAEYKDEAADSIWMPYVIAMTARQQCSNLCGTYLELMRNRPESEVLKGIYNEKPFVLRGIRLQINSKIHTLEELFELASYIEAQTKEPVALSLNGTVYDWYWSLGEFNAH